MVSVKRYDIVCGTVMLLNYCGLKKCTMEPYPLALKISYEDENFLVIDKPAGLPSIPTKRYPRNTLANAVVYYYQSQGIKANCSFG